MVVGKALPRQKAEANDPKSRQAIQSELPHVKGTKTPLIVRNQHRGSQKPDDVQNKKLSPKRIPPIYADEEVCTEFGIKTAVRPSDSELDDIVMYGELAQLTYDSFRNDYVAAQVLGAPRLGDPGFEQRHKESSMTHITNLLQPDSRARLKGYKIIDLLYANSGWHFNEVEKAVLGGVGELLKKLGKDKSPSNKSTAEWFQQEYNWVGFVAVSKPGIDGKQDLVISFRGTVTSTEWMADIDAFLINALPWRKGLAGNEDADDLTVIEDWAGGKERLKPAKLCRGFKQMYAKPGKNDPVNRTSPQEQINQDIKYIFQKKRQLYNISTITCIGHSLGGALALLAAYDLAQEAMVPDQAKVRVCNFEAPKVGDRSLVTNMQSLRVEVTRVVNVRDVVPSLSGFTAMALKQLGEAMGAPKHCLPEAGHSSAGAWACAARNMLQKAGREIALEVANWVEEMARWEHSPCMGPLLGSFCHIADPLCLDTSHSSLSKILRQPADIGGCHNLEVVLHMLDPTRDICLVNKGANALSEATPECQNWWARQQQHASTPPKCPNECISHVTSTNDIHRAHT